MDNTTHLKVSDEKWMRLWMPRVDKATGRRVLDNRWMRLYFDQNAVLRDGLFNVTTPDVTKDNIAQAGQMGMIRPGVDEQTLQALATMLAQFDLKLVIPNPENPAIEDDAEEEEAILRDSMPVRIGQRPKKATPKPARATQSAAKLDQTKTVDKDED